MKLKKLIVIVLTAFALSMTCLPASATPCEDECYQEFYDCIFNWCMWTSPYHDPYFCPSWCSQNYCMAAEPCYSNAFQCLDECS